MNNMENTETKVRMRIDGQTFEKQLLERHQRRPFPWQVLSTRELAEAFGVHLQTLHNWGIRGKGPSPEPRCVWRGNRRYYTIANIIAWLDDRPAWHVYRDWIKKSFHNMPDMSETEVEAYINDLIATRAYKQPIWRQKRRSRLVAGGVS